MKHLFAVGDLVFIKCADGGKGDTMYRITQVAGIHCAIAEVKKDGTLYRSQPWATALLIKASRDEVANAFNKTVLDTFFGSIK